MSPTDTPEQDVSEESKDGSSDGSGRTSPRRPWSTDSARQTIGIVLAAMTAVALWNLWASGLGDRTEISYSAFRQNVRRGNVESVRIEGETIEGRLGEPIERQGPAGSAIEYDRFVTYLPSFGDDALMEMLESNGVEVLTEPSGGGAWWSMLVAWAPILFLLFLGHMMMRRMQAQGRGIFGMKKSQARSFDPEQGPEVTFDDVAGCEGPKRELREVIEFLKSPSRFRKLGGEMPHGLLMVGPPGTGKTLMARAVAGEADVPFFSITGSDFMEMFVGVGASRVRDMFEKAKKQAPAIIFIDELDSIGRRRGAGLGGGHDEREQTLNQLLSEMDGFEPNQEVILMAATNRPDILDPALLRPGRFDRQITVDLPTRDDRREILEIHGRDKELADEIDLDELARGTPGFSGADLENLLNEAALLAARDDKERIERDDVERARDKVMMGLARDNLALTDEEREMLAYHEAGHALLAVDLPRADPLHKVTIVPRGKAMGVTQQLPEDDKYLMREDYLLDRLAVMMGGRAAEELIFETVSSGAENDLREATRLARKMVLDWGMSDAFRHLALGGDRRQVFLGEELAQGREHAEATAREVDEAVREILETAHRRAADRLEDRRDALDRLAEALLDAEELDRDEVVELLDG